MAIHENRPVQQFSWIAENSDIIDIEEVLKTENENFYDAITLEKDAY